MPGLWCCIETLHLTPAFTVDADLATRRDVYHPSARRQHQLDMPISLDAHNIMECDGHAADLDDLRIYIECTDDQACAIEDATIECHLYDERLLARCDAIQLQRRRRAFVAGLAGVVGPGEQAKQTSAITVRMAFMPVRASGAGSE